ncbi:hypothetical protein LSCM1_07771 [Leishmania martiniquensis]|uniref:Uncharacterized protein n=1 Tax=Leishmania martiniquensis TaxID=1580590 RepID=A0A836KTY5_9TRYP|nr:hypothetical protein LSCM1_07771 [Leishmania martiniquensis]
MEAWCGGVQRLTQDYFSALRKLLVAHLSLRAPSQEGGRNSCGGGAAEMVAITSKLRRKRTLNSDLDVQVADIEAMETALLQQLSAHRQQRRQGAVVAGDEREKKYRSRGASRGGASAVAAAVEDTALDAACSLEGSPFLGTQSPSTSAAAADIPEELLELFRTAQALRSASPGRTGPPPRASPSKEAAAGEGNPLEGATGPSPRAPVVLSGEEEEEAAVMALQCFRYFYSSNGAPASPVPATAPPVSDTPLPGQPAQPTHVHEKRAAAAAPPEQRGRHPPPSFSRPALTPPTKSSHARCSTDASSPMSLGTPAAWRKLIAKPGTADRAQKQPPQQQSSSSSLPGCAADHVAAESTASLPQQTQRAQGDYSFGFPTPCATFRTGGTPVDAHPAAEKVKLMGSSSDNHFAAHRNASRWCDRAGGAACPSPLASPTEESPSKKGAHNRDTANSKGTVKLPPLSPRASPASAAERAPSLSASPPLPSPTTTTALVVAAAGGTPHLDVQHAAPPALALGTATAVPTTPTAAPPRIRGDGANKERNRCGSGQRRRAPRPSPTPVVLPPTYSGAHGELLTTAQLEGLVASASHDGAMAQADMQRQYDAAATAAEELYRLQQAVARVLLENVQLEKDILTLKATSHAGATGDEGGDAGAADRGAAATLDAMEQIHSDGVYPYGSRATGISKIDSCTASMAPLSSWALSPTSTAHLLPEKRTRQIGLPPAPMPRPQATSALTAASLLLHATPAATEAVSAAQPRPRRHRSAPAERTKQNRRRSEGKARAGASASAAAVEAAGDGQQDPRVILQELRTAIASCEAKKMQTLAEIDALSSRVSRHDSLLQAVAEYWRRNAAVMKRQHFAVQSQPKQSTSSGNVARLFDGDNRWGPEHAIGAITSPYVRNTSGGAGDAATRTSSSHGAPSASSQKLSHSIAATATTTQSGHMNLDRSPSQLQQALAQMEAISPTPLSSSPSFDLHTTPSVASALSPPLPKGVLARRQIVPLRRRAQDGAPATNEPDGMRATLGGVTGAPIKAEHIPVRVRVGVHATPAMEEERGGRPHRKVMAHSREGLPAAAAATSSTLTDTNTTGTTLLGSPNSVSDTTGRPLSSSEAVTVGTPEALKQERRNRRHGHAVSAAAVTLFNDAHPGTPGHALASSPGFAHAHDRGAGEDDDSFQSSPLHPSGSTTANHSHHYPSGGMRREDEDVLGRGSWRPIHALQLENVDEIAEFIYSVFEQP